MAELTLEEIVALCKRRGFIFPASEIYGGFANTYDYGHYGVLLKNNVKNEWWRAMLQERDDIVALDSAIIQHPKVWEASGHLAGFTDPLVQCLGECKQRWREDDLREEQLGAEDAEGEIRCPVCGGELSEPRQFNLMFETYVGPVQDESHKAYLRPETAQGIFINFKNVLQFSRKKPPFGIAQIGKSFRNEITPGNFIFRTREFEQMEMEFFVPPAGRRRVARVLDGGADALVHRPRHPAREAAAPRPRRRRALPLLERDLRRRVPLPDGLVGARGDRQPRRLRPHPARQVLRREARVRRLGHRRPLRPVRGRAGGRGRPGDALLHGRRLRHRGGRGPPAHRAAACIPRLAPVKVAVLPLVNKDGQPEKAREIYEQLRELMPAEYDTGGSIGKRYRRQDEIGTPWGVTVDHQTMDDDTVTLRDRDSLEQIRLPIAELGDELTRRLAEPWSSPKLGAAA